MWCALCWRGEESVDLFDIQKQVNCCPQSSFEWHNTAKLGWSEPADEGIEGPKSASRLDVRDRFVFGRCGFFL